MGMLVGGWVGSWSDLLPQMGAALGGVCATHLDLLVLENLVDAGVEG